MYYVCYLVQMYDFLNIVMIQMIKIKSRMW